MERWRLRRQGRRWGGRPASGSCTRKNVEMVSTATGTEMGQASYIQIKHEEERREAAWKEPESRVFSATTRTNVTARLGELHDQILAGHASFADLAAQHFGCSSARRRPRLLVRMIEPIDVQKVAWIGRVIGAATGRLGSADRRSFTTGNAIQILGDAQAPGIWAVLQE